MQSGFLSFFLRLHIFHVVFNEHKRLIIKIYLSEKQTEHSIMESPLSPDSFSVNKDLFFLFISTAPTSQNDFDGL